MAALIRGVLRGRITASIAGRQRFLNNISNKALKDDMGKERMSRDCRLMLVKAVAAQAEKMIVAHDSKINPVSGISNQTFKPSRYWCTHMLFAYLLCFSVGMESGAKHARKFSEEYRKDSISTSEANQE